MKKHIGELSENLEITRKAVVESSTDEVAAAIVYLSTALGLLAGGAALVIPNADEGAD